MQMNKFQLILTEHTMKRWGKQLNCWKLCTILRRFRIRPRNLLVFKLMHIFNTYIVNILLVLFELFKFENPLQNEAISFGSTTTRSTTTSISSGLWYHQWKITTISVRYSYLKRVGLSHACAQNLWTWFVILSINQSFAWSQIWPFPENFQPSTTVEEELAYREFFKEKWAYYLRVQKDKVNW